MSVYEFFDVGDMLYTEKTEYEILAVHKIRDTKPTCYLLYNKKLQSVTAMMHYQVCVNLNDNGWMFKRKSITHSSTLKATITKCPRCGEHHGEMVAKLLKNPIIDDYPWFILCPKIVEPILLKETKTVLIEMK